MPTNSLIFGLLQFVVVTIVVLKVNDGKVSRVRAIAVGLIVGVIAIGIHILFQQISFPEAIAHWVQTGSFR
jgi:hypothetical protein